jgi:methylase of polypeptide subunit release factors
LALYGGNKGLEIILTILQDSKKHLNTNGQLWIEHEPEQSEAIRESAETSGFRATTYPDQYGVERFSMLISFY